MNEAVQYIHQEFNEKRFNRKHIDGYIRHWIASSDEVQAKILEGVSLIETYISKDYYKSKNARIEQLKGIELIPLVEDIFIGIAYVLHEELFTSITAQMAFRLKFSDKAEAITTVAEILAVLCNTDVFDICKANKGASLVIVSKMNLPVNLIKFIEESQYLPPMVCVPNELENNYDSGYLTHSDSLILGTGNHHSGDICLDVLNKINKVAFKLDLDFISQVEEEPTFDLDTQDKINQWNQFKIHSYRMYDLLQSQGNKFYFTHKVDKRGRIYAEGYHVNYQGSSHKKAMVELANEEIVEGEF